MLQRAATHTGSESIVYACERGTVEYTPKLKYRIEKKNAVTRDAIADEAVCEDKLESGAISSKQLTSSCVCLSNIRAEVQCETTGRTPATIGSDKYAVHSLEESYDVEPLVLLIPMCDLTLFIGEVSLAHGVVKVTVGLGSKGTATALKYRLVAIRN